jgi:hypothetical protein
MGIEYIKTDVTKACKNARTEVSPSVPADLSLGRGKDFVAEPSNRGGAVATGNESIVDARLRYSRNSMPALLSPERSARTP